MFESGRLDEEHLRLLTTPSILGDGEPHAFYGLGMGHIKRWFGMRYAHAGTSHGYTCEIAFQPDRRLVMAACLNTSVGRARNLEADVWKYIIKD